jgi:hypothetical protein
MNAEQMVKYKELNRQMKEIEEHAKKEDDEARKVQQERWGKIASNPDNYEWQVKTGEERADWDDRNKVMTGVIVSRRVKQDILKEYNKCGYPTFSNDMQTEDKWFGCFYYRTAENILTHYGGGYLVLNDPMLCSDEEWAQILSNNIPLKYRK